MADAVQTETPAVETPTQPATRAASDEGNFTKFREASQAERRGTPLPPVPVTPAPTEPVAETPTTDKPVPAPQVSKRQEKTNDAIREAVDRATKELREENDRLKASVPKPAAPAEPVKPNEPAYKRYLAMPNAPKLGQFETLEEHAAAMADFIWEQRDQERIANETSARERQQATKTIETFQSQITEAGGKTFLDGLHPDVQGLRPAEVLQAQGEQARIGPRNVLASHLVKSARAPQLLQYLSDHPDELAAFDACQSVGDVYLQIGKVEARVDTPAKETPAPKTVTSMPAPPSTLSTARSGAASDPSKAAADKGDFLAFRAAERAKRSA